MGIVTRPWALTAIAALLLAGCSQSTPQSDSDASAAPKPAAPTGPVAAKTAFYPMYTAAHTWAPDVMILRVAAKDVPGFTNGAGKAAMWEATFGSPSQAKYRVDQYAITTVLPDIHKGATAGLKLPWGGLPHDAQSIDIATFNVDSDAAYNAAAADAADWLKKNPDKKLSSIELDYVPKLHATAWFVMWGDQKSGYATYVDDNTGQVIKKK